jgi:hypothetical protein
MIMSGSAGNDAAIGAGENLKFSQGLVGLLRRSGFV